MDQANYNSYAVVTPLRKAASYEQRMKEVPRNCNVLSRIVPRITQH